MVEKRDTSGFSKQEIKDCLNTFRHGFDVAIYGTKNYFNFGAIVRISHNFLCRNLYNVDIGKFYKKAAMSGTRYENIHKHTLESFLQEVEGRNLVVFERRPDLDSIPLDCSYVWPDNPVIVFGAEDDGVPDAILEKATHIVGIPVYGLLNDHNVAVAAGIAMFDWTSKHYKS